MASDVNIPLDDLKVDGDNLYREDIYTDLRIATLRCLTPVKRDGSPDPSRTTLYMGQTQLMSQGGMLPVHCEIEATSIDEAITKFPEAIRNAVEQLVEQAKELRRRESSRIITPDMIPGTGKIHLG